MPNMNSDGFIDQAQFVHQVALLPGNADYGIQIDVTNAIGTAAKAGLFTCAVNVSAYSSAIFQLMIERLVNMGYGASMSAATTLTVTW